MLTFVVGENNTGKSAYAESLVAATSGCKRYYIATMIPYGEEGKQRVAKHLKMREHLGMITLEDPFMEKTDGIEDGSVVLLEDLSNLVANRMFENKQSRKCIEKDGLHNFANAIMNELLSLNNRASDLIIVSIGKLSAEGYDEETARYVNTLNELNHRLMRVADNVVEMGK